jgi:hypothetical protein
MGTLTNCLRSVDPILKNSPSALQRIYCEATVETHGAVHKRIGLESMLKIFGTI